MTEKRTEVKTIRVRAICNCGGEFKPTGMCLTSYPPQYPHKCDNCGKVKTFEKSYPTVEYVEVEND